MKLRGHYYSYDKRWQAENVMRWLRACAEEDQGVSERVSWGDLTGAARNLLERCIQDGPQHVDESVFDAAVVELQRHSMVLVARMGGEWYAFHTPTGWDCWRRMDRACAAKEQSHG